MDAVLLTGTIRALSRNGSVAAVEVHDTGEFTVMKWLGGGSIAIGDRLLGALDAFGSETLFNVTQRVDVEAFIQAIDCSANDARRICG